MENSTGIIDINGIAFIKASTVIKISSIMSRTLSFNKIVN
jgi:hypothetical protein